MAVSEKTIPPINIVGKKVFFSDTVVTVTVGPREGEKKTFFPRGQSQKDLWCATTVDYAGVFERVVCEMQTRKRARSPQDLQGSSPQVPLIDWSQDTTSLVYAHLESVEDIVNLSLCNKRLYILSNRGMAPLRALRWYHANNHWQPPYTMMASIVRALSPNLDPRFLDWMISYHDSYGHAHFLDSLEACGVDCMVERNDTRSLEVCHRHWEKRMQAHRDIEVHGKPRYVVAKMRHTYLRTMAVFGTRHNQPSVVNWAVKYLFVVGPPEMARRPERLLTECMRELRPRNPEAVAVWCAQFGLGECEVNPAWYMRWLHEVGLYAMMNDRDADAPKKFDDVCRTFLTTATFPLRVQMVHSCIMRAIFEGTNYSPVMVEHVTRIILANPGIDPERPWTGFFVHTNYIRVRDWLASELVSTVNRYTTRVGWFRNSAEKCDIIELIINTCPDLGTIGQRNRIRHAMPLIRQRIAWWQAREDILTYSTTNELPSPDCLSAVDKRIKAARAAYHRVCRLTRVE